jgi:hypothetical protein
MIISDSYYYGGWSSLSLNGLLAGLGDARGRFRIPKLQGFGVLGLSGRSRS